MLQVQTVRASHFLQMLAHQADERVQVHGLVGLMGEVYVTLTLEAGELDAEQEGEPAVLAKQVQLLERARPGA